MTNPNNAGELILGLTQLSGEALVFMPWRAAVGGEAILQMRGRPLRRSTTPRSDIKEENCVTHVTQLSINTSNRPHLTPAAEPPRSKALGEW